MIVSGSVHSAGEEVLQGEAVAAGVPAARDRLAAQRGVLHAAAAGERHRVQRSRQGSQGQGESVAYVGENNRIVCTYI